MFEELIPSPAVSAEDIARNSPLVMSKLLVAAAIQKSDELAEFQAKLESQRSNISWLRLETRVALGRAIRIAKNNIPNIAELKTAEDQAAKGIAAANKAVIRATTLIMGNDHLISAVTTLLEAANDEMRKCRANTEAEIEERHATADRLAKTSADILGLIQSIEQISKEVSRVAYENEKDMEAENQLANAREALGLRLAV